MSLKFYTDATGKLTVADKKNLELLKGTPAETFARLSLNIASIRGKKGAKIADGIKNAHYRAVMKPSFPVIVPDKKDPMKVRVYPNIKRGDTLAAILASAVQITQDEKKKVRLETRERAVKLALKSEETTMTKVIAEHTNLKELGFKDDQIAKMAEGISTLVAPLRLVFCEKPEDYYTMYKTKNGSCMTVGSSYYGEWSSKSWITIAEDTGMYPSAWYHYQPHAKGGYLLAGDTPVARFMVYRTDLTKDEWPCYGDIKYSNHAFYNEVVARLKALGKTAIPSSVDTLVDFRVPALYHELLGKGTVPHCPLPFADSQRKDFSVAYDENTDEFVFGKSSLHKEWKAVPDMYTWRGYIDGSKIFHIKKAAEEPVVEKEALVAEEVKEDVVEAPAIKKSRIRIPKVQEFAAEPKKPRARKPKAVPVEIEPVKEVKVKEAATEVNDFLVIVG